MPMPADIPQEMPEGMPPADMAMAPGMMLPPQPTYRVTIRRAKKEQRVRVMNVPPEEFLIDLACTDLNADTPFCAHRFRRTRSELIAMGYDKAKVEKIPFNDSTSLDADGEAAERKRPEYAGEHRPDPADESASEVWVNECYIRVDRDGDGYAELRKVTVGGDGFDVLLDDEEVDDNPFASWTPNPMPHKFYGESLADKTIDIQELKTALWRGAMDNLYRVNLPQKEIVEGQVNMAQALNPQLGGVIQVKAPNQMREIVTPAVFQHAFTGLEFVDTIREKRTGVTAYNQGLDADTLNKTATGINAIMGAANLRAELVARTLAETGFRRAFRIILKLITRHQDKPKMIRLRNQWVEMSPSQWNPEMDVTVSVGLGSGNKDQQIMHATNLFGIQKEFLAGGKAHMVSDENLFATCELYIKAADLKQTDKYFTDPKTNRAPPPPPDPKMIEAQGKLEMEKQKAMLDAEIKQGQSQMDAQLAQQKMAAEIEMARQKAMADIQLEREKAMAQIEMERERLGMEMQLRQEEHQATLGLKVREQEANLSLAEKQAEHGARLKTQEAETKAEIAKKAAKDKK